MTSTWISSVGEFIDRFETEFATMCGVRHAVSCCNGTAALHVALLSIGVGIGDEVLIPSLTYVATANAVRYCGATPVFVDVDPGSWTLDPADFERKITPRAKAVIPVHLFGRPADMTSISAIAGAHGLKVIEDAAQAHGAAHRGRPVGSMGQLNTFSFFGNKIVTSGEGGMVVTDDHELAAIARQIKGQGQDPKRHYWFPIIGYNYRMTNVQAAIGLAQLEQLPVFLEQRDVIAAHYVEQLSAIDGLDIRADPSGDRAVCWLFSIVLREGPDRDVVRARMLDDGIDTRPFFPAIHLLPPYRSLARPGLPVTERLAERGMSLPTWVGMTSGHIERVVESLRRALNDG